MDDLRPARILQSRCGLHRGVARARGRSAARRFGDSARLRSRSPASKDRSAFRGGRSVACLAAGVAALLLATAAQAQIVASRIWPARDYTRLTLESKSEIKYEIFSVKDPERLVLDLETDMTPALTELDRKVAA